MTRAPLAVVGLGGVGGALAARTGALCVGTERTVEAIRERGLTLVHGAETTVVHPEATTRLERPVALLVVAVKAYDLDPALDRVDPEALDGAVVLPLLNGLEHVAHLRARLRDAGHTVSQAPPAVAAGTIGVFSAAATEPGVVVQATAPRVRLGRKARPSRNLRLQKEEPPAGLASARFHLVTRSGRTTIRIT